MYKFMKTMPSLMYKFLCYDIFPGDIHTYIPQLCGVQEYVKFDTGELGLLAIHTAL